MLAGLAMITHALAAEATSVHLEVFVNGASVHLIGAFQHLPDGRIGATVAELKELGFKTPPGAGSDDVVLLDDLTGVHYRYEAQTQSIHLTAEDPARLRKVFDASGGRDAPPELQTGTGAVLSYTLFGSATDGIDESVLASWGGSAMLDGRIYGTNGTLAASGIVREFSTSDSGFLPLDVTWSYSDTNNLLTSRVGDLVAGGLAWTRPIRMGGVQFQRNFSLRPDLIVSPLPAFSGSAVVPSTVDVYINNTKAVSQDVPAGPFQINNIPVVSSSGSARVVVRDAAGRETETTAPFFASSQLLRADLYDFSGEVGFARRDYGIAANTYDEAPIASLSGRYGLSNAVTLEGHGEAAPNLLNVGVGLLSQFLNVGRISAATSVSAHDGQLGGQLYAALELSAFGIEARASTKRTLGDYADLGTVTAEGLSAYAGFSGPLARFFYGSPPIVVDQLTLGLPLPFDRSRLGLTVLHIETEGDAASADILSASYSRDLFDDVSFFATAFQSFGENEGLGVYAGVCMPFGDYGSVGASLAYDRRKTSVGLDYSRPLSSEPGSTGWHVRVIEGETAQHDAALSYRGTRAEVHGRVAHVADSMVGTAEISGSVVVGNDGVFFANRVDDAFAVVEVGQPDVDVLYENRVVARTGTDGKALVTGLTSYQTSRIAIDPSNLPLATEIDKTSARVTPAYRSGVSVNLAVRPNPQSAVLIFRRPDGSFVPVGTRGRIDGRTEDFVIGYDGQAFVTDLSASHTAVVGLEEGSCRATFAYYPSPETQTVVDPVICR